MDQPSIRKTIAARLAGVEERLAAACGRAGRQRSQVTLVGVTKTISPGVAALLPEIGLTDLGENRPQELWRKAEVVAKSVHWHLIGHLQRNKVARTLPLVTLIHSVDSVRLLRALEEEATRQERSVDVLLEVNASGEASKQGLAPNELHSLTPLVRALKHVRVRGLMTMAALQAAQACRPTFAALRRLRDELLGPFGPSHDLGHLSMGMSNDFEVAVEEGATLVRLGTVLFEGLS